MRTLEGIIQPGHGQRQKKVIGGSFSKTSQDHRNREFSHIAKIKSYKSDYFLKARLSKFPFRSWGVYFGGILV